MKIFCIGRNYVDHIDELANERPAAPVVFMKPATARLMNGTPFYYPDFTELIHYECELVIKVAKNGRSIAPQYATNYIEEVSVGIDFTARDLQTQLKSKGLPWEIAKAFDNSAPIGTFIPCDPSKMADIRFHLQLNGQTVQNGHTALMLFDIPTIISYISTYFTLQKGDLIYTGTPAGVGPIKVGDHLEGYLGEQKLLEVVIK